MCSVREIALIILAIFADKNKFFNLSNEANVDSFGPPEPRSQFMERITPHILAALLPIQDGFIVSIRSIDRSIEENLLQELIAELFPLTVLFCQGILDLPTGHMELQKFLESRGVNSAQNYSRRIIQTLAHGLYTGSEDRESANQTASLIISHGRPVRMELGCTAPGSSS